jgi:hypothetical protein
VNTERRPNQESSHGPIAFDEVVRVATETLLRDGYHIPTIFAEGSSASAAIQIDSLASSSVERQAQLFIAAMQLALEGRLGSLQQVILITEAWMSEAEGTKPPVIPPSEDPNRREILIVTGRNLREDAVRFAVFDMVRDAEGQLVEIIAHPEPDEAHKLESPLLDAFIAGYKAV